VSRSDPALADYETHPELRPAVRCAGLEDSSRPSGYSPHCQPLRHEFSTFRATAARQGRSTIDLPPGRAFGEVEDPLWFCNQHVISDEPPDYGSTVRRNFRKQKGGAVGEMILQLFTAPASDESLKPVSLSSISSRAIRRRSFRRTRSCRRTPSGTRRSTWRSA
jgi:hypothetical protein